MLQNAYLLAKIGADIAENERNFAKNLPKIGNYPTGPLPYGTSPPAARPRRLYRSRFLEVGSVGSTFLLWRAKNLAETTENQPNLPTRQFSNQETHLSFYGDRRDRLNPARFSRISGICPPRWIFGLPYDFRSFCRSFFGRL